MNKLFRSTNYGFHISVFLSAVALFAIFIRNYSAGDAVIVVRILLIFSGWIFVLALSFILIACIKLQKIDKLLFNCEIEEFVSVYEGFSTNRKLNKDTRMFVLFQLSTGYLNIGNIALAGSLLEGFDESRFLKHRLSAGFSAQSKKLVYYNNLVDYYLRIEDTERAAATLVKFKELTQNPKLKRLEAHNKLLFESCCEIYQFMLNMAKGNYDGCEEFFNRYFEEAQHQIHRVSAKYNIAKTYLHQNRLDEAKRAYQYVAQHGGSTYYRCEALAYLGKH